MNPPHIAPIAYRSDNYAYAVILQNRAVIIDPGQAAPIRFFLRERTLSLSAILLTHFHGDHAGGTKELQNECNCPVYGADDHRVKADRPVADGQDFAIDGVHIRAIAVAGHTRSDFAYAVPEANAVFTGDALFVAGCGRLFECGPEQMFASLMKMMSLDDATRIYCGHEYTEENLAFATMVEPDNPRITQKLANVRELRSKAIPSVPSTVADEKATNPFVRVHQKTIRRRLDMEDASDIAVFAELRRRKDRF
jgi:hydroxyacylglutathione hydrolase